MKNHWKAHLALLGANLFYGAGFTVAKQVMPRLISPAGFIFIRVLMVTVLFWLSAFGGSRFRTKIRKEDWKILVLGGLFGVALNQMLFFLGLNISFPIHASLIMMSTPLLITVISIFIFGEKLTASKTAGLFLGIGGAAILMLRGQEVTLTGNTAWGDFLIFLNAASYAVYLVIIKPLMLRYRPVIVIRWVFLFGFLFVFPFGWPEFRGINWSLFRPGDFAAVGFIVVFVTFFTYLWNVYALRHLSPATAGAYIYLQPVFAAIISVTVLGETLSWTKIFATLCIFSGVFLVNFGLPKRKNKAVSITADK